MSWDKVNTKLLSNECVHPLFNFSSSPSRTIILEKKTLLMEQNQTTHFVFGSLVQISSLMASRPLNYLVNYLTI